MQVASTYLTDFRDESTARGMPYPIAIKQLAYANDPTCWKSYSGMPRNYKRYMDGRRAASLGTATHQMIESILKPETTAMGQAPFGFFLLEDITGTWAPKPKRNPPMKISMLMHFHYSAEAYAPEHARTSQAYTKFVKELLRDKLIERPSREEREESPGWAYRTTDKGRALVNAICTVREPVAETTWVIPQ